MNPVIKDEAKPEWSNYPVGTQKKLLTSGRYSEVAIVQRF